MLFGDNDALSVVLGERRVRLHPRWNRMNQLDLPWSREIFGERMVSEALRDPAIRHFEGVGDDKPWDPAAAPERRALSASPQSDAVGVGRPADILKPSGGAHPVARASAARG